MIKRWWLWRFWIFYLWSSFWKFSRLSRLSHLTRKMESSSRAFKWDQSERSQFFRYKVTAVFVRGLFSEGVVEVRGSKLQIRCRLILLISEHPIQRGIRKECWHRIPGNGTEFLEIWPPPKKTAFSGGKTKKKLPKFFSGSGIHIKNTFCKKIGSKRPFQPSAVVRTIYRCLYGVATAN